MSGVFHHYLSLWVYSWKPFFSMSDDYAGHFNLIRTREGLGWKLTLINQQLCNSLKHKQNNKVYEMDCKSKSCHIKLFTFIANQSVKELESTSNAFILPNNVHF